ncbi:MAG: hypothetical protein COT85_07905 [Chlamydiae bacterium CG10_big_fil_rev_8_21_14_0_10_42_34]|nr:MAG: hypothetical protein COT85_07905 [Chlamydiae bacterium CG10_big_fil_rev_8_21_14_0_10_42_34]
MGDTSLKVILCAYEAPQLSQTNFQPQFPITTLSGRENKVFDSSIFVDTYSSNQANGLIQVSSSEGFITDYSHSSTSSSSIRLGEWEIPCSASSVISIGIQDQDFANLMMSQLNTFVSSQALRITNDMGFASNPVIFCAQMNRIHQSATFVLNFERTPCSPSSMYEGMAVKSLVSVTSLTDLEPGRICPVDNSDIQEGALVLAHNNSSRPSITEAKTKAVNFALGAVQYLQRSLAQMGLAEMDIPFEEQVQVINTMAKFQSDNRINQALTRAFSVSPERPLTFTTSKAINAIFHNFHLQSLGDKIFSSGSRYMPELKVLGDTKNGTVNYFCGINNNVASVLEAQAKIHESLDGRFAIKPHHVHDDSLVHGVSLVACAKLGIDRTVADYLFPVFAPHGLMIAEKILTKSNLYMPASVDKQVEQLSAAAREIILENNPNLKQICVTFSNGAAVLKETLQRMPQAYRDTVIAIPVGPTIIIDKTLAAEVYTIIGDKDGLSLLCNGGLRSVMKKAEDSYVRVIPQKEMIFGGHYFIQEQYQKQIKTVIAKEILPKYEIH